jgi:hypothetical protein
MNKELSSTMKKLKHSKYKNTGLLFELLVRKLTSETLSSDKSIAIDIIKKYFGKNTELSRELQLYNAIIKEQFKSDARALDFIKESQRAHSNLNHSLLRRQKYNLVKEISENFKFESLAKGHINNYKVLASIYMLFEYQDTDNVKQLTECKNVILDHVLLTEKVQVNKDPVLETFKQQDKSQRLLTYKLLIDKFNQKYSTLSESQKRLLNKYITHVNDTDSLLEYIKQEIPAIKKQLATHSEKITDQVTQIKVKKLSEMLCNVETMKVIKESHILSLLRYFELVDELTKVH